MKLLRLFHRTDCHLCEEMLEQLEELRRTIGFELEQVDIDTDAGLKARYGHQVPVLEDATGHRLCEVFLDPASVMNYLRDA